MHNNPTPAWTLILVPPTPRAAPRRIGVKMRTLRMFAMLMIGLGTVTWAWMMATSDTAEELADRLAAEQRLTAALDDTVQSMRMAAFAKELAKLPPTGMMMPINGEVTSRFSRSRFHPILQLFRAHRGVDLAAPMGTRIAAPAAGRVASVGRELGYGLVIEMVHSGGVVTRYAHLRSALVQRRRQRSDGADDRDGWREWIGDRTAPAFRGVGEGDGGGSDQVRCGNAPHDAAGDGALIREGRGRDGVRGTGTRAETAGPAVKLS